MKDTAEDGEVQVSRNSRVKTFFQWQFDSHRRQTEVQYKKYKNQVSTSGKSGRVRSLIKPQEFPGRVDLAVPNRAAG